LSQPHREDVLGWIKAISTKSNISSFCRQFRDDIIAKDTAIDKFWEGLAVSYVTLFELQAMINERMISK